MKNFRKFPWFSALTFALPMAAAAERVTEQEIDAFVGANLIGIFYHELGHALIDLQDLPIFGQEEDAADVLSILLIDALYEEGAARDMAALATYGFMAEAVARDAEGAGIAWWDVHGPDEQRSYNTICLFYGANPEMRADMADEFELPKERRAYCPDEFQQAADSWGDALDELTAHAPSDSLHFIGAVPGNLTGALIADEIKALNAELALPHPLAIKVESCGEANAFYDPDEGAITICDEFEGHLRKLYELL